MTTTPPRIWMSNETPQQGEIVRVRTQVAHVMESGFRLDAAGQIMPRQMMTRFEARLDETLLLTWLPEIGIAQNPYLEFTFKAQASGLLRLLWVDDSGTEIRAERQVTLA